MADPADHTSPQTAALSLGCLAVSYVTRNPARWASFLAEVEQIDKDGIGVNLDDARRLLGMLAEGMQVFATMDKMAEQIRRNRGQGSTGLGGGGRG